MMRALLRLLRAAAVTILADAIATDSGMSVPDALLWTDAALRRLGA